MNSKRSMLTALFGVVSMGVLITNCTIKTATDDDTCTPGKKKNCTACDNGVTGTQTCQDDGTYDACVCPDSTVGGGSNGGASSSAGTSSSSAGNGGAVSTGGASSSSAGEAGAGGEGGEGPTVFATCGDCLDARCATEYNACFDNPNCISAAVDGSGQYERIAKCINQERIKGLVKRDVVRGCGVTMGTSPAPDFSAWAPEGMDPTTTALINCMADAPGAEPASWANDDANYPVDADDNINPTPWPAGTCAKDACTSPL